MSEIGLLEPFSKRDEWTLHCDACGGSAPFRASGADDTVLVDLAHCTYLQYWLAELRFLEGLETILRKHRAHRAERGAYDRDARPSWWPEYLARFRAGHWWARAASDPPLEADLIAHYDAFGRDRTGSFDIERRKLAGRESIEELEEDLARSAVLCTACGRGRMYIDPHEYTTTAERGEVPEGHDFRPRPSDLDKPI